ncbi:hypothetical protein ACWFMI_25165 [Nocardiopsis terrae]|uniref:hypothetical protein n=1 Tax=Streptomyces sp. NPDC057554 TaxID=3350538 RepID=UPI003691D2A8
MTPTEVNAFIGQFIAMVPRPSDQVQTGPHPPAAEPLHGPLADLVDLDAWLEDYAIPNPPGSAPELESRSGL